MTYDYNKFPVPLRRFKRGGEDWSVWHLFDIPAGTTRTYGSADAYSKEFEGVLTTQTVAHVDINDPTNYTSKGRLYYAAVRDADMARWLSCPPWQLADRANNLAVWLRSEVPFGTMYAGFAALTATAVKDELARALKDRSRVTCGECDPMNPELDAKRVCAVDISTMQAACVAVAAKRSARDCDPRVLHDYGDGTGLVHLEDVGELQKRSEASSSFADARRRQDGTSYEVRYQGNAKHYPNCTKYVTRVRISELPPLPGETAKVVPVKATPVVLPCVGPLQDDLFKAGRFNAQGDRGESITAGMVASEKKAASDAWSRALAALQAQAREEERLSVLVQREFEDHE